MGNNDRARIQAGDLRRAISLLTRLPVESDGERAAQSAWSWPLVGLLAGLLAALAGWLALGLGLPVTVAAALALSTQIFVTGAMHEDGLADCADGFWGGETPARRLEIMRDSRIGSYGVIAIVMSLLLRLGLLAALFSHGVVFAPLLAAAALSRVPMVALMHWLEPARSDGLSVRVGRPDHATTLLAAVLGLLLALLLVGFSALIAALVVALLGWALAQIAMARIAGQTGDVLGASQQLCEIGALAALAAVLL